MAPVDVSGLAAQWESNRDIRARVRSSARLFIPNPDGNFAWVNIKTAGKHYDVLAPIVSKLRPTASNPAPMVTIAAMEKQ